MTFEEWTTALIGAIGIEWWRIPIVIFSAVTIYLVFYLLIHIFGPRILTCSTSFDAAVIIMLGAVAGRVVIGHPPTLAPGVIGLVTLVLMEVCFGALNTALSKSTKYPALGLNKRPVIVFAHGKKIEHYARKTRVTDQDLAFAFRRSGIAAPHQVQCAIMEPNGFISVIREGESLDPALLTGVVGQEFLLPDEADTLD